MSRESEREDGMAHGVESARGQVSRRALLQNVLFELHLPYRGMEEGELRLSLIDHLEPRGSGLGLPIVQQIVSGHNGKITCSSDAGYGTTFKIVFPTAD